MVAKNDESFLIFFERSLLLLTKAAFMYLIKNTVKIVILWNIITIKYKAYIYIFFFFFFLL